jgi:hypothetical protein
MSMGTHSAVVLLALVTFWLAGCGALSSNVTHYGRAEKSSLEPSHDSVSQHPHQVLRVYMDRVGDLYPLRGWSKGDETAIFPHDQTVDGVGRAATLWHTFAGPPEKPGGRAAERPCGDRVTVKPKTDFWQRILDIEGMRVSAPTSEHHSQSHDAARRVWAELQGRIRVQVAQKVDRATRMPSGQRRPLLVLVHGFNTGDPDQAFKDWLAVIQEQSPGSLGDVVVLQIGWDGLEGRVPGAGALVWSSAQYNFPLVGQSVRKLFNAFGPLARKLDVRILTHSSGGPVVAHALWDASDAEGRDQDEWGTSVDNCPNAVHPYRDYLAREATGQLPPAPIFSSLRLVMVVPAGPASLFTRLREPINGNVELLAWGWSELDHVVNKLIGTCGIGGATCLAARLDDVCSAHAHVFALHPHRVSAIDMLSDADGKKYLKSAYRHDMDHYLRSPAGELLARGLLVDASAVLKFSDLGEAGCVEGKAKRLIEGRNRDKQVISNNPKRLKSEIHVERQWVYRTDQ